VAQAVYNSIYFSQMVFPDFDMFQSHNPNGVYHAIARTINNGPIYLTDVPGKQNFDILNKIVFKDGKSIRASSALMPSEDCLFQLQDARLFKTQSMAGTAGLLGLFNVADSDKVQGGFKAADVNGIKGNQFVLYEYFRGKAHVTDKNTPFKVDLPRLGYELVYVLPVTKGFAAFGLVNKYNAPATIVSEQWNGNGVSVKLYEGGMFKAYSVKKPASVRVNGKEKLFSFKDNLLNVTVDSNEKPVVEIRWK
jgi:raffinose synthase